MSHARTARQAIVFGLLVASTAGAVLLACSSDERPSYDSALPDANAEASLPPQPDPEDAGADADAAPSLADERVICDASPCVTQITSGVRHVCARMSDGTVRCWGDNTTGALGVPIADASAGVGIAPVVGIAGVTQVSASEDVTCVLLGDGSVSCWGANDRAQLGLDADSGTNDSAPHPTPSRVALPGPATEIDVMPGGACAVLASGGIWCWGANGSVDDQLLARSSLPDATYGAPGLADRLTPLAPSRVGGESGTRYALTPDGKVMSWGYTSGRESSLYDSIVPMPLALSGVTTFAFDSTHQCVLAEGEVWCWAISDWGIPFLCSGLPLRSSPLPVRAPVAPTKTAGRPQRIAVGSTTTCARLTDGTVQCCGDDSRGQMGTGTVSVTGYSFHPATAFEDYAVQVVVSEQTTCALTRGGSVRCWGGNSHGELGQGTHDDDPHPTPMTVAF
jgi:alpha-tubulin suppressor-like RCC1 family protein